MADVRGIGYSVMFSVVSIKLHGVWLKITGHTDSHLHLISHCLLIDSLHDVCALPAWIKMLRTQAFTHTHTHCLSLLSLTSSTLSDPCGDQQETASTLNVQFYNKEIQARTIYLHNRSSTVVRKSYMCWSCDVAVGFIKKKLPHHWNWINGILDFTLSDAHPHTQKERNSFLEWEELVCSPHKHFGG